MDYLSLYASFIASHGALDRSPEKPVGHFIFPPSFRGEKIKSNTVFLSPREYLHAYALLWKIAPNARVRARLARGICSLLGRDVLMDLGGRTAFLARSVRPLSRGAVHPQTAPDALTLFHTDGRTASGTQPELSVQTGLAPGRIRDLKCGRRPYASGWTRDAALAKQGPKKKGRPRRDFFALS